MNNNLQLTVSQFARAINRSPQWVSNYIRRGKIIKTDGYIDLAEPQNKLWLQRWTAKGNSFDIGPDNDSKQETKEKSVSHPEEQSVNNYTLDAQKKQTEISHIRAKTRNEEIKYRKHSQNLISQDEARHLFEHVVNKFHENYRKNIGRILSRITDEVDISKESYIDTRKTVESSLSDIHEETRKQLLDGLQNLADQYSEVRGRGEQK